MVVEVAHRTGTSSRLWAVLSLLALTLQLIVYLFIAQFCGLSLTHC